MLVFLTHAGRTLLPLLAVVAMTGPTVSRAQAQETTFVFRPHCTRGYEFDNRNDTVFGPLPSNEQLIDLGDGWEGCSFFEVEDPQTLRTKPVSAGDVLDFDVLVKNPGKIDIAFASARLTYDPNVLEGMNITVSPLFPEVNPGGSDFIPESGEALIAAGTSGEAPNEFWIPLARVQMKVLKSVPTGTVISYADVQSGGGTEIVSADEEYVIGEEPGSLLVRINEAADGETDSCGANEDCPSGSCVDGTCAPLKSAAGDACEANDECENGICYEGTCRGAGFKIPDGGGPCERDNQCLSLLCVEAVCASANDLPDGESCTADDECASGTCSNGTCGGSSSQSSEDESDEDGTTEFVQDIPEEQEQSEPDKNDNGQQCSVNSDCASGSCVIDTCRDAEDPQIPDGGSCELSVQCQSGLCTDGTCREKETFGVERTAFGLLQIQNLRVTTDGSAAFLAWDPLQSSDLKGYNIYYGTTSSQYIQRKTVNESTTDLAIRSLPEGNRYYFAVRGVSTEDEESAFSEEQSVIVGNPESSTSPLVASAFLDQQAPTNPLSSDTPDEPSVETVPGETGATSTMAVILVLIAGASTMVLARKIA